MKTFIIPRSKPFVPDQKDGGGQDFLLFVFVSDVEANVDEGMDQIEHM